MRAVLIAVALAGLTLSACQETANRQPARHNIPLPPQLMALMSEKGMHQQSPILIRSFKKESELEVWKMGRSGRYEHLKTYPICRWSGQLGPKKREGDRMAPEGFYTITPAQMNPNSSFYLSFNMGYPNAFDRAHGRTGAHLMVHGACSSMGCYSMSDDQMAEIYALVREAHNGGQRGVQMQALPFRMSPENLARFRYDPNMPFWRNLKEGADIFEVAKVEPRASVCQARYAFNRTEDCREDAGSAQLLAAAADKRRRDEAQVAELVAKGAPAVRVVYEDGGQHRSFTQILTAQGPDALHRQTSWGSRTAEISRVESIINGPREVAVAPGPAAREPAGREPATRTAAMTPRPSAAERAAAAQRAPSQPAVTEAARAPEAPAEASGGIMQRVMSFNPFASAPAPQPVAAPAPAAAQPTPPARPVPNGQRRAQAPADAATR